MKDGAETGRARRRGKPLSAKTVNLSHGGGGKAMRDLIDSVDIDRLNFGPIPTPKLDWLQPHEGNRIEFLYRNRALQVEG